MSIEEVIEKLEEMYRMDNPVMYGKRGTIRAAIEMLREQVHKEEKKKDITNGWNDVINKMTGQEG